MAEAAGAKGTLAVGAVGAETVADVALCIMETFRRGANEAVWVALWQWKWNFGMVNIRAASHHMLNQQMACNHNAKQESMVEK